MEKFIVIQVVANTATSSGRVDIAADHIIRVVDANSKEEAIGKFVLDTNNILFDKKLKVECYDINEITRL